MIDDIALVAEDETLAKIKIIGVGGAGNNAVNRMIEAGIQGVEFITVNCDSQDLNNSLAPKKILIGENLTKGLGAGGKPEIGEAAARESIDSIRTALKDTDMLFITAGMGGGTGTGAAPVIAECARELGILTVGVVSKPFRFEGKRCMKTAMDGLARLSEHVDTIIPIPNEALFKVIDKKTPMKDAFIIADNVLCQGVEGVSNLIAIPGFINLDFADIQSVMRHAGTALMGIGIAKGNDAANEASNMAINNPLLENSIEGATGVIINICGGPALSLMEVNEALNTISEQVDENANIIFGTSMDESMGDCIKVSVIATGFVKVEPEKDIITNNLPVYNDKPWQKDHYVETSKKIADKKHAFNIAPWINRTIGVN